MSAKLRLLGFKELSRALEKLPRNMANNAARAGVRAGAAVVRKAARNNLPSNYTTLRKSLIVKGRKKKHPNITTASVGPTTGKGAKYDGFFAHMVEFGVKPHEIKPKNAKTLLFFSGGDPIFRGVVKKHPGVKQIPFMRNALNNNKSAVLQAMRIKLAEAIKKQAAKLGKK